MRWLCLLALAACDPTLTPDPPQRLAGRTDAISLAYGHVLAVTGGESGNAVGELLSIRNDIPEPQLDEDDDGEIDPLELPPIVDVAAGRRHACVISTTGTVFCWGDQSGGALGPGRDCPPPTADNSMPLCILPPERLQTLPPARELTAGDDVTCATAEDDDAVYCWGDPDQRGGSALPPDAPLAPVRLPGGAALAATRVIARGGDMCAIAHDRVLWCWGEGFGLLPQRQPQTGVVDLAVGRRHACMIDDRGLSCWGDNRNGQVGDLDAAKACPLKESVPCSIDEPYPVDLDAVRVAVGDRHTCALDRGGTVTCFGSNEVGQLGRDDAFLVGGRGRVIAGGAELDDVTELVADRVHTCALRNGSELWCWGNSIGAD